MGSAQTLAREAWDRFLLYLPLFCMAVLALKLAGHANGVSASP